MRAASTSHIHACMASLAVAALACGCRTFGPKKTSELAGWWYAETCESTTSREGERPRTDELKELLVRIRDDGSFDLRFSDPTMFVPHAYRLRRAGDSLEVGAGTSCSVRVTHADYRPRRSTLGFRLRIQEDGELMKDEVSTIEVALQGDGSAAYLNKVQHWDAGPRYHELRIRRDGTIVRGEGPPEVFSVRQTATLRRLTQAEIAARGLARLTTMPAPPESGPETFAESVQVLSIEDGSKALLFVPDGVPQPVPLVVVLQENLWNDLYPDLGFARELVKGLASQCRVAIVVPEYDGALEPDRPWDGLLRRVAAATRKAQSLLKASNTYLMAPDGRGEELANAIWRTDNRAFAALAMVGPGRNLHKVPESPSRDNVDLGKPLYFYIPVGSDPDVDVYGKDGLPQAAWYRSHGYRSVKVHRPAVASAPEMNRRALETLVGPRREE